MFANNTWIPGPNLKTVHLYIQNTKQGWYPFDRHVPPPHPPWRCGPTRVRASSFTRFLDHIQRHITVGRTPLDERSARRRDLYLTTHNTHNRQISMPPGGFEPTISAGERPHTYASDRAATGTSDRHVRYPHSRYAVRSLKCNTDSPEPFNSIEHLLKIRTHELSLRVT